MSNNQASEVLKQPSKKPLWIMIGIVLAVVVLASIFARLYLSNKQHNLQQYKQQLTELGFYTFTQPRILSSIEMTSVDNAQSKPFLDYAEGWRIVNFGYLACPDICPINLSLLGNVKRAWDSEQTLPSVDVVHVTFDPARDKPEILKEYLGYMHQDFYGLTADLMSIKRLAQELNVIFIHEKPDEEGNYFVTHSDSLALINPQGEYIGLFKGPYNMDNMIKALRLITDAS